MSLLQKKTQVPDKPDPATTRSKKYLLTLSARCLSHQSLLHIGYREVEDKEKLVTERHRYNLESVDGKMKQKEFVVASPQQQQVIASFTASSTKRHLVLEGPAGTGKTLVAKQVANNLLEYATDRGRGRGGNEPLLVVTTNYGAVNDPIMKYLGVCTWTRYKIFKGWLNISKDFGVPEAYGDMALLNLTEALAKRY
jgi:DNA replication protein DnaC